MNEFSVKQSMAKMAREVVGNVVFDDGNKPSDFFSQLGVTFEEYWNQIFQEEKAKFVGGIWTGGTLPNGSKAPEEATPNASYWIMVPNGSIIFQYENSLFVPETPGLVPGILTTDNVEEALNRHIDFMAENSTLEKIINNYLEWLSQKLL